jgi:hypothetical protein
MACVDLWSVKLEERTSSYRILDFSFNVASANVNNFSIVACRISGLADRPVLGHTSDTVPSGF